MKKNYLLAACCVALSFVLSSVAVCLPDVADVLKGAVNAESGIARAAGTTSVTIEENGDSSSKRTQTYKWAFEGRNWRQEIIFGPTAHMIMGNYNGNDYVHFVLTKYMKLHRADSAEPNSFPTFAQYIGVNGLPGGAPPASQMMAEAQVKVAGTDVIDGNPCVILQAGTQDGRSTRWWLAQNYGNRLIKLECSGLPVDASKYKGKAETTTFSNFVEKGEGVWMPQQTVQKVDVVAQDGSTVNQLTVTASTVYESVNTPLDPSAIYTQPAPDVKIVNEPASK